MNVYLFILLYVAGAVLSYIISVRVAAHSDDDNLEWMVGAVLIWPFALFLLVFVGGWQFMERFTRLWIETLRKPDKPWENDHE